MTSYYSLLFLKKFKIELLKNSTPLYIHEEIEKEDKKLEEIEKEIEHKVREDFVLRTPIRRQLETNREVKREIKELSESDADLKGMQRSIMSRKESLRPRYFIPQNLDVKGKETITDKTTPFMEISQKEKIEKTYPEEGLYLGEIEKMVNDNNVSSLECPGPNKFVSVRVQGMQKITRIQIDKEDINAILESFSREARIPRIGGIFKAIVNNLVLTAIDTDVAGPRFIITKIHPQRSMYL